MLTAWTMDSGLCSSAPYLRCCVQALSECCCTACVARTLSHAHRRIGMVICSSCRRQHLPSHFSRSHAHTASLFTNKAYSENTLVGSPCFDIPCPVTQTKQADVRLTPFGNKYNALANSMIFSRFRYGSYCMGMPEAYSQAIQSAHLGPRRRF